MVRNPTPLKILRHRQPLQRTRRQLAAGKLTIGFLGGSVSDGRPVSNWPEPVVRWFVGRFPKVRIVVENAAIGSTGSDLAVFRAQRDIIDRNCDLVFVEYAVNDYHVPTERRNRTREGLLRKLLAGGGHDLVLPYIFCQGMYDDMASGRVPASIAEFESLAEHYGIGSVWTGLAAFNMARAGQLPWDAWLPDGIHPQHYGSQIYANSVIEFLEKELIGGASSRKSTPRALPRPLNASNWEHAIRLRLDTVETEGPWAIHRWPRNEWIDQVLHTSAPGARLRFSARGRCLAIGYDTGKAAADFRYRVDGGPWLAVRVPRPDWVGAAADGEFVMHVLAEDLPAGQHQVEIEVMHGGESTRGTHFRMVFPGVVP